MRNTAKRMILMEQSKVFVTSSWDDVAKLDVKLCELLETYKLKGTFFAVNNWIGKELPLEDLIHISEKHEIGAHTLSHATLTQVSTDQARKEISESRRQLEEMLGKKVTSFAYPKGQYDKIHVEMVHDAGYLCARTTKPFFTTIGENPYELGVTIWAAPHRLRDMRGLLRLFNISPSIIANPLGIKRWNELGKRIFDRILESGGVFHFFGHSWQVDKMKGWQKLEDLLAYISFRENVAYVTMSGCVRLSYHGRNG